MKLFTGAVNPSTIDVSPDSTKRILLVLLFSFLFPQRYSTKELTDLGFENVYTETKDDIFILVYENRKYRT